MSGNILADNAFVSTFEPDPMNIMKKALHYLSEKGHRKIAYLSAFDDECITDIRLPSFISVYDEMYNPEDKIVITGEYPYPSDMQSGYQLAQRLLESSQEYTAVLTTNDMMAIGCIKAFNEAGIRIPEDVSVMGIDDDTPLVECIIPPLTTLAFDKKEFAESAFDMLYDGIATGNTFKNLSIIILLKDSR